MAAITSLLLVIALSLLVTRVASAILVATGLDGRVARFQARSALSGAGFTTAESEQVVSHPVWRRVVMTLMLLGNAGLVASASTLILGFRSGGVGDDGDRVLELVVGVVALVGLSRNKWFDRHLTRLIAHVLRTYTDLPTRDLGGLLQLSGSYEVSELAVDPGDWLDGRTLGELDLRDEGVAVLGVTRADGRYLGTPVNGTRVRAGDTLLLYGLQACLQELDHRSAGDEGERQHTAAVARQRELAGHEQREDSVTDE